MYIFYLKFANFVSDRKWRTVAKPLLGANRGEGWFDLGLLRWFLLCIFLSADLGSLGLDPS